MYIYKTRVEKAKRTMRFVGIYSARAAVQKALIMIGDQSVSSGVYRYYTAILDAGAQHVTR